MNSDFVGRGVFVPGRTNLVFITTLILGWSAALSPLATQAALSITSGPTLTPAPAVPLACTLELGTSEPARVFVEVNDGVESWRRDFFRYDTVHSFPLFGFKAGRNHSIKVSVENVAGTKIVSAVNLLAFNTAPLPASFPRMEVLVSQPSKMEPGYTIFRASPGAPAGSYAPFTMAVNSHGEVVWYTARPVGSDLRQLANGNLLYGASDVFEVNFLAETVNQWHLASGVHHDTFATKHGTILTLRHGLRTVDNYPTSDTDPNAPKATSEVDYDIITEFSRADGTVLQDWHLIDILDPLRIGYDSATKFGGSTGYDWSHSNSVIYDDADDSIIVSSRHQDAVIKFSRATGDLIWILGNHDNWSSAFQPYLFEPVGTPFEWQYHQHAARYTSAGTLMIFDNGNFRASPFDPRLPAEDSHSRGVEFALDQTNLKVQQVWEYGTSTPERLFSAALGLSDPLPLTKNVLMTFGFILSVDGKLTPQNARLIEVTHAQPAQKVFELAVRDDLTKASPVPFTVYRSPRFFDFYAKGDLDMDGDVDRADLDIVLRARNKPALSPLDPRDLDRDGRITALDARLLAAHMYAGGPTE